MDYKLIAADSRTGLADLVKKYLKQGYKPLGGIQVISFPTYQGSYSFEYVQAMIKIEELDKEN